MDRLSYRDTGVDLGANERFVRLIGGMAERTSRAEVVGGIGGFAGLFAFDAARYRDPLLVSATDGAGTKVELARRLGVLDTVGQDLVAMVCNDLVVTGAEPLFFNDHLVVGALDPERAAQVVSGVADGCRLAGCALVGGEIAEHPGLLAPDQFDLAGFGVGVVERGALLGPHRVRTGDVVVAMASSGLHANGFSLVRRVVAGMDPDGDHGLGAPLRTVLLTPTRIYVRACLALTATVDLHALCHVTGGGIPGNLPRVLPGGLGARIDVTTWERPAVFDLVQRAGAVADEEMWRVFNCGVGMLAVLPDSAVSEGLRVLHQHGLEAWVAGQIVARAGVELAGSAS